MANIPIMENIDFNIEPDGYEWSMAVTPVVPSGSTFPVTFTEAIPIHFKIEWGAFLNIPGLNYYFKYIATFKGKLNGYTSNTSRPELRLAVAQDGDNFGIISISNAGDITVTQYDVEVYQDDIYQHTDTYAAFDQDLTSGTMITEAYMNIIDCNLPITFGSAHVPIDPEDPDSEVYYRMNQWSAVSLTQVPELERVLSWSGNSYIEPEGDLFEIDITGGRFTVTPTSQTFIGTSYIYQFIKGKILSGKFALYKIPGISNGQLRYGIKSDAEFYALQYSTDGYTWTDTDTFPFTYFLRPRDGETGTFDMGISIGNNTIPIFDSEQNAQGYLNGTVDINSAMNWGMISGSLEPFNETGDEALQTEFGHVYTRSFFNQQYICDTNAIQDISNALYDTTPGGLWEDIKKGLDMFGDNPIESVVNLVYYPLSLSTVFTNTQPAPSIWFGGYEHQLTQGSASKILYPDGYFSCGTVVLKRTFNNYKDFPPYTRIFVDIPYCGTYEIDPAKYYGKTTELRYFIDTRANGLCTASLIAAGTLVDQFNGQLGVSLPMILTDFSAYANNQLNTLLGNGGQAVSGATDIASSAAGASSAIGLASMGVGAAAFGAVQGAKTAYGLTQNNINKFNKTKGGSSAMLNQYLPQKAVFTFEIQEEDIPSNFYQLNGGATNAGGTVGSFSGYLECDQIKLNIQGATESEKERIRSLLMGGVFI